MTIDEVREICEHLASEGVTPSGNSVVAYCHATHRQIAKKTVLKYLKLLAAEGVTFTPAAPAPLSHDPDALVFRRPSVDDCEAALLAAEVEADVARENMDAAVMALWLSRGLLIEGVRYGGYMPGDPALQAVQEHATASMGHYRQSWHAVEQARTALEQAVKQYRRKEQESWVAAHKPNLVANLALWQHKLQTATSDWQHAEAKKNVGFLQLAYSQALIEAPVNGTQP
jgi:hypothetical protein